MTSQVTYNDYSNAPLNDDGINFSNYTKTQAVQSVSIANQYSTQKTYLSSNKTSQENADIVNANKTQITLTMNPISTGPFNTTFNITVSKLTIPKTIDLENA